MKNFFSFFSERAALYTSLVYISISLIYILFSDYFVTSFFSDTSIIRNISIYKGFAFVISTGILIYLLIKKLQVYYSTHEDRYRILSGLTQEGIVIHDKGIVIDINDAFSNFSGFRKRELVDKNIVEQCIKEEFKEICFRNILSQYAEPYDVQALKKNGEVIWVQIIGKPFRYHNRKVRAIAIRDITQRKLAEIALAESEKQLSVIFDSAPMMMMLIDKDFKILRVNQATLNTSGKTEHEVIKQQPGYVINCIHNLDNKRGCGYSSSCSNCSLRNIIKQTFSNHSKFHKVEAKIHMGSLDNVFERNVLFSTEYIEIDNLPTVFVSIDDITERVQMENILTEKNSILLKAQELARIGEFQHDLINNTLFLSSNLMNFAGFEKNRISFSEFTEKIHPEDIDLVLNYYTSVLSSLDKYTQQFRIKAINSEYAYIQTQAEVERDKKGNPKRVFGVAMDITNQKKTELQLLENNYELQAAEEELTVTNEALMKNIIALEKANSKAIEADKLKSAFLANMSHEIRTPMNAIMGFADILDLEDTPFDKRKEFTKIIRNRAADLLNIINDILDISKLESHTLRIVDLEGNVDNLLHETKQFFETRNAELQTKSIEFTVTNELTDEQNQIITDFQRIKQVLFNLIDNAYKFTNEGTIDISCKFNDKSTLIFTISDTGIGISKEKHDIIFERFRQADESYLSREFDGVGLGLSICKGILELMNGKIWVESEKGIGSRFCFTIPYRPMITTKLQPEVNPNKYNFSGKKILIVEDTPANLYYLTELLTDHNATVIKAVNGTEALKKFNETPGIDLVLMDIKLPDINGFELTQCLKQIQPTIKVIAQTAYTSSEDIQKCFDVGCSDYISKPISSNNLFEKITIHIK